MNLPTYLRDTRFPIALAFLVLVAIAGFFAFHAGSPRQRPGSGISAQRAQMKADIKREGPQAAYQAFVAEYKQKDFSVQHNTAHLFGEALYDVVGLSGIAACDTSFNYGCYHGFLSEAIAAKGLSVVEPLAKACDSTPTPLACVHGVGHGIVEYVGPDKLVKALEACDLTHPTDPIAGCRTGVFMEYNIPIVFGADGTATVDPRLLTDPEKPDEPCPSLPAQYQLACYYSLPSWWAVVYANDPSLLKRYCAAVPGDSNQMGCVTGLGTMAGQLSRYQPAKAVEYCTPGLAPELRDRCMLSAAQSFHADIGDDKGASTLCALVPADERSQCTF